MTNAREMRALLELNARKEADARRELGAQPLTGQQATRIRTSKGDIGRRAARHDN
jgi:hypothetical protein